MASEFNKTIKACLRFLGTAVGEDHPEIRRLRKLYMKHKRSDENAPLGMVRALMAPHADKIAAQDLEYFKEHQAALGLNLGFLDKMKEDEVQKLWTYVGSMHVMAGTLGAFDQAMVKDIQGMAEACAKQMSDPKGKEKKEVIDEMLSVTAKAMPELMKKMGVNVNEADVLKAQEKIMSGEGPLGDLGKLIGGMVDVAGGETGGQEHEEISKILG
jgi:hypothetical protein